MLSGFLSSGSAKRSWNIGQPKQQGREVCDVSIPRGLFGCRKGWAKRAWIIPICITGVEVAAGATPGATRKMGSCSFLVYWIDVIVYYSPSTTAMIGCEDIATVLSGLVDRRGR
jgi:hypothetical protein